MSTSSAGSAKSSRYLNFDEYVDLKLQTTRASIKTTDLLVALAGVAAMFLGYLLLFVTFDQWIIPGGFGIGLRWTLLSTLLVLTAAWLIWKVGVPYFRSVNRLYAAREIEKADPTLRSNLLNLVDLRASGREIDPAILRALEKNAAVGLQNIDVTQAVDHRPLMRTAYVLLAVVILFCLYALLSPKKISNSIWRSLLPAANVTVSTRTEIVDVQPGDTTVLAREKVLVTAEIAGEIPPQVFALFTTADGKFRDEPVELRSDEPGATRFSGLLIGENGQGLLQDLTYTIQAGDATSRAYRITVIQPPSATVDRVTFEFPAYMKLDPTEQAGGKIDSWEGTRVAISAHTNIPVQSATVEFLDSADGQPTGEEAAVTVAADGRQLTAAWTLAFRSDRTFAKFYRIQCRTESGATDPQPTVYEIQIRPDLPPDVALLEPVRDLEVPANAVVPLLIEARDPDFELSHINLHLKKNGQPIHKQLLSEGRQQRLLVQHDLALERFVLVPGDVLELWIQAFDNKQPRPNIKVTPELKLTIVEPVSKQEVQERLAQDKAQRDQRLQEARQDQNPGDAQDARPAEPGDAPEPGPDAPRDGARPDPMPQEQQNDPQQGPQNGADQAGQDQGAQNGKPGDTRQERGAKEGDGSERPLRSDGEDDQQALEQILKSLDPDPKKPDDSNNQDQTAPKPKPNPDQTSERNSNSDPMPGGSERPMPGSEKNGDPKSADSQPMNSDPAMPSDSPMPSNPKNSSQGKPSGERPMPGSENAAKPDPSQPGSEMTDSPEKTEPNPSKNSNSGDPKRPPKAPGDSKNSKGSDTKPAPQDSQSPEMSDPNPGDSPNPDAASPRKTDKPSERPDPANPSPGDSPTGSSPDAPMPMPADAGPTPGGESPKNSDMPPAPGKSAGNRDAGERPMPKGNDATGNDATKPDGTARQKPGTESPAPDAPNAQPKPADGTEKGTATPDRDPKSKPGTSDSPDVQRDPKQPPERRPGNTTEAPQPPGDEASPPKNRNNPARNAERTRTPSDQKVNDAQGQKNPTEQQQLDQQNTTDKESMKGQPDRRPGDPNSANEDLKGDGAEQQRSRTGSGGEGGSSKEDKSGKSGSSNSGEGDSSDRPGSTEKADPPSGESTEGSGRDAENRGKPKPGSRSDGKSSDGKSPAGAKPEGAKPGQEGTPDGGQGQNEPGKGKSPDQGGGDEKSADSPEGGAKPGSEGASKQGGGGEGQKGQSDSGGKKAGTGQPGTTEGGNAAGGAGSGPIESEAANLEYKKQATELVLKRLQEGLERGDIDPELLERLGWSPEELRRFTDRLARHLEESRSTEESPESAARRQQFEEMLKSLDVHRRGTARQGENSPQRDINFTDSSRNTVPKEYRSAYEKFSREINRQKNRPAAKP